MPNRAVTLVRKLRGRDLAELRERGGQAFAAWRERAGYARGELAADEAALARRLVAGATPDPAALLADFRARPQRFMPAFDDPAATVAALGKTCPGDRADVMARAERVLEGAFDLLGYEGLSYGRPVEWNLDPVRGRRAPGVHWSRVPYLDVAAVGDHKVTWEVNRQQYLVTLGQAYWYTGDERWANAMIRYVTDWLDANPPKRGINWASSLEVAFRAMSWAWALHFLRGSDALAPEVYARVLSALHVHARHLERYLSTYFSPNTHLTGEALGLVHVGALFPELAGAQRWLRTGLDVLSAWLPRQVRPDGGYFEQATQYHRYTTEFALHLLLLDGRHGWGLDGWLRPLVGRLAEYLQSIARPDGTIPLIGDDDGGKLVYLDGRRPDDVRGLFAQLAVVLDSPSLAHAAGPVGTAQPAALWLVGKQAVGAQLVARAPEVTSRAFRDTGVFVMRDGWGPDAAHAVIDCGPHGAFNAGHAHADLLSITASAFGRPLLVDAGTYTYSGPERNAFRSASAHNALLVDGCGSSEPADDAFQWRTRADGRLLDWLAGPEVAHFEGEHTGFAHLGGVGAHRRSVLFLPGVGWVVRDRLQASGQHSVRLHWHLAPGLTSHVRPGETSARVIDSGGQPAMHLFALGSGTLTSEPAWASPRYGARIRTTRLVYEQSRTGTHEIITVLAPIARASAVDYDVREIETSGDTRSLLISVARTAVRVTIGPASAPASDTDPIHRVSPGRSSQVGEYTIAHVRPAAD